MAPKSPSGSPKAKPAPAADKNASPAKKRTEEPTNKSKKDVKKEQLNEEDQKLKDELEALVNKCCEADLSVTNASLKNIEEKLKTASSTMTSVPKPLKFMRPHYEVLKKFYESKKTGSFWSKQPAVRQEFADLLSVLAAVKSPPKAKAAPKKEDEKKAEKKDASGDVEMKDASDATKDKKDAAGKDGDKDKKDGEGKEKTDEEKEKEKEEKKDAPFVEELDPYKVAKSRECLKYRLEGVPGDKFVEWGHEYVRHLAGEIMYCYQDIVNPEEDDAMEVDQEAGASAPLPEIKELPFLPEVSALMKLVEIIVPFQIKNNEGTLAIDMLFEVDQIERVLNLLDANSYERISAYLLASATYAGNVGDSQKLLKIVYDINMKFGRYPEAERVALKLKDDQLLAEVFEKCTCKETKIQMCYVLRQHRCDWKDEDWDPELMEAATGENWMKKYFQLLAKELDVSLFFRSSCCILHCFTHR